MGGCCGRNVGPELVQLAASDGIGVADLGVARAGAGLVVNDDQAAVGSTVDPVDRPPKEDLAPPRHRDGGRRPCRVRGTEGRLGPGELSGLLGTHRVIVVEPQTQIDVQAGEVVVPDRRVADGAGLGRSVGCLVEGPMGACPMLGRPRLLARPRAGPQAEHRREEIVERLVDERTAIERGDDQFVNARLLGVDPQEMAHEVALWATRPALDTGWGDGGGGSERRRHRHARQVAVESGEIWQLTSSDEAQPCHDGVIAEGERMVVDLVARADMSPQRSTGELLGMQGKLAGGKGFDMRGDVNLMDIGARLEVVDPPRRRPHRGTP